MTAGVGVVHVTIEKEKSLKQIFDRANSVKAIYKQSSGIGLQAMSLSQP